MIAADIIEWVRTHAEERVHAYDAFTKRMRSGVIVGYQDFDGKALPNICVEDDDPEQWGIQRSTQQYMNHEASVYRVTDREFTRTVSVYPMQYVTLEYKEPTEEELSYLKKILEL